jgi:hypothetical protein
MDFTGTRRMRWGSNYLTITNGGFMKTQYLMAMTLGTLLAVSGQANASEKELR